MNDSVTTRDIFESVNRAADRRAGRSTNPLVREALGSFNRKGTFTECHDQLSGKILAEVAKLFKANGIDVRLQDHVEVMAVTPVGTVIEVRREGGKYFAVSKSADSSSTYFDGIVESLEDVSRVMDVSR
jgi:hypothetical protein